MRRKKGGPSLPPGRILRDLANSPAWLREAAIAGLKPADQRGLRWAWAAFARDSQQAPAGDWRVWLVLAGRGFGKTRLGAEWVLEQARRQPGCRIALVGASLDEVRKIMIEGESGIRACAPPDEEPKWNVSRGELLFKGGSVASVYSGANGDGLRGPQHHFAWADELGKWSDAAATWSNLQLGLRLGEGQRAVITTTPGENDALLKTIADADGTVLTEGASGENLALPESWHRRMETLYRGTRLALRELDGKLGLEADGALWSRELIEQRRIDAGAWGTPVRVVIGVDPPATSTGDACGIMVCGRSEDGRLLVLADLSCKGLSPAGWAARVAAAAADWGADRVVAETNNGGEMVLQVLRAADANLPVQSVHAAGGKGARAEPIAVLFENGRAGLAGRFPELEGELCQLTAAGYKGAGSPDRADAMVWAMNALAERAAPPAVRGF